MFSATPTCIRLGVMRISAVQTVVGTRHDRSPRSMVLGCLTGYSGTYDAAVRNTAILHGNYDYKTNGVAFWDGGANHALKSSMYYTSKPAFFGNCNWPVFGPDFNPVTRTLPAKARYDGSPACDSS